jgi:hypothetical protein
MKIISLRTLLRNPGKVKRITRAGKIVRVTDHGQPLWVIHPAPLPADEIERAHAIDELLDEALRAPRSKVNASQILEEDRR